MDCWRRWPEAELGGELGLVRQVSELWVEIVQYKVDEDIPGTCHRDVQACQTALNNLGKEGWQAAVVFPGGSGGILIFKK